MRYFHVKLLVSEWVWTDQDLKVLELNFMIGNIFGCNIYIFYWMLFETGYLQPQNLPMSLYWKKFHQTSKAEHIHATCPPLNWNNSYRKVTTERTTGSLYCHWQGWPNYFCTKYPTILHQPLAAMCIIKCKRPFFTAHQIR